MKPHRAVFLDRDGTINRMVYNPDFGLVDSPLNPEEFDLCDGAAEAIAVVNRLGLLAVVVSNQPIVAKGKCSLSVLDAITAKMERQLAQSGAKLDGIFYCLHHPEAKLEPYRVECDCRKPLPGLLLRAARELDINLSGSYMLGDGITDVLAGQRAAAKTVLISARKCYTCDAMAERGTQADYMVGTLLEAARLIASLEQETEETAGD